MTGDPRDLESIFAGASGLAAPEERGAYLDRACGDDVALRGQVESLLAAHDRLGGFLEGERPGTRSAEESVRRTVPIPAPWLGGREGPGIVIDRYKLLQEIGEGGFGTVFMAEQQAPIRRMVALKIIKLGMDTQQVIARFEAERQALAMMNHPNIAQVFDAGATVTGRPYFVMELVRGIPVTEYCDREKLDLRTRLHLFQQICFAVQHAHQKGIIHRDLKPSNVLVTIHDGRPIPKVIDFGIAKATNARLTDRTLFTEFRQLLGTPAYMSPEQADTSSLDVDTRSDIYSLGVLLYELLTGTTPLDPGRLRRAVVDEIQKLIRDEEAPRPSTRVSSLQAGSAPAAGSAVPDAGQEREETTSASEIARNRCTDPRSLVDQLQRDLDWIVLKSLEKDRTRRYDTVGSLAADIQRYLDCEPVEARPASRLYRLGKTLRRHRVAVGVASAFATLLIAGIAALSVLLVRLSDERDGADLAREESEAVTGFLSRMVASISPENRGPEARVRDALDGAAAVIGEAFADRPRIEARLRHTIGASYLELDLPDRALEQLPAALAIRRRLLGDSHPETLNTLDAVGSAYGLLGRRDEARACFDELLATAERAHGPASDRALDAHFALGVLSLDLERYEEAERHLRTCVEGRIRLHGEDVEEVARARISLANARANLPGGLEEAEELYRWAWERQKTSAGSDSVGALVAAFDLAKLLERTGRSAEAIEMLRSNREARRRVLGPAHRHTLDSAEALASMLADRGQLAEAERIIEESLSSAREAHAPADPRTLEVAGILARIRAQQGRLPEANALYEEFLPLYTKIFGLADPRTLVLVDQYVSVLVPLGEQTRAETLLHGALAEARGARGGRTRIALRLESTLAFLLTQSGRHAEALELLRTLVESNEREYGPEGPDTLAARVNLGSTLLAIGRAEESAAILEETLPRLRRALGDEAGNTRYCLGQLAETCAILGRWEDAERLMAERLALESAVGGPLSGRTLFAWSRLDRCLAASGRANAAEGVAAEWLPRFLAAAKGSEVPPETLNRLAWLLLTAESAELRDAGAALDLAGRAAAVTGERDADVLDTLALARSRTGDAAGAAEIQRRAIELLPPTDERRSGFESRLAEYEGEVADR